MTQGIWKIKKTITVSGAHRLELPYDSPCKNLHGHNWKITVSCRSEILNDAGMIIDFTHIKKIANELLDHQEINLPGGKNPTAENICKVLQEKIPFCYRVDVEETEGSVASYEI